MNTTQETPHTYENNRVSYLNTKHCGTVVKSVKNTNSVSSIESEILETLKDYGGDEAHFIYWFNGTAYTANYSRKELELNFTK